MAGQQAAVADAGELLLAAVVGQGIALAGERYILLIVEYNDIVVLNRADSDGLFTTDCGIASNIVSRGAGNSVVKELILYSLVSLNALGGAGPVVMDRHIVLYLFPVGNERQVAGGAGGDFKTQLSFLAAAGGAFAHGPAQELIAFPDRVNQGKAWRADIVIGGVGVGAAGPSGLIRAAVIQIIGNVELLQLQLEDNYVLGVVGGKDGFLGIDTVL